MRCPFCKKDTMTSIGLNESENLYQVTCHECWAFGPMKKTKKEAKEIWLKASQPTHTADSKQCLECQ